MLAIPAYANHVTEVFAVSHFGCGCSSVVEHNLAKVGVEGSNPFARSKNGIFCNGVRVAECIDVQSQYITMLLLASMLTHFTCLVFPWFSWNIPFMCNDNQAVGTHHPIELT